MELGHKADYHSCIRLVSRIIIMSEKSVHVSVRILNVDLVLFNDRKDHELSSGCKHSSRFKFFLQSYSTSPAGRQHVVENKRTICYYNHVRLCKRKIKHSPWTKGSET